MKKIIVAHDGSDAADRALFKASAIAEKFGAQLTVVSAVPNLCFTEIGVDCNTVNILYRSEVEGIMSGLIEIMKDKGINAETLILEGSPADAIVDYAKSVNADLIVVGSTGKHATERTLLGSVSSKIATNAPCAVLIVK